MAPRLEPLVVFWSGRGIHFMVVLSFAVQITLMLLADLRRRADWPVLKVIIWSAYMLADTVAIYALGHLSVVVRLPEHHLMALWAPVLLVHLGGQDNITAYAIEDNRLWLRHLQTFGLQLVAAGYVLYASSILSHPSLLRSAAILMFVVGVVKYGERVLALMGADRFTSSNLFTAGEEALREEPARRSDVVGQRVMSKKPLGQGDIYEGLFRAYSLLDVPKEMFEGPTRFVKIKNGRRYEGEFMLKVVAMQLTMMYVRPLVHKGHGVHTWYGFLARSISLLFTVVALLLFHALGDKDGYTRLDVLVTKVLLTGAVVLEAVSVLRAVFSMWTAALLYERKWYKLGRVVQLVELVFVIWPMKLLVLGKSYWSGHMRQHDLFKVPSQIGSTGSRMAEIIGMESLWDSWFSSWSTRVPKDIINMVLELVSTTTKVGQIDIRKSRGQNALNKGNLLFGEELAWSVGLDLEESILVWHIATHVYLEWFRTKVHQTTTKQPKRIADLCKATKALCNYMFFLLASRPYMLPYPVNRQRYVQLCHDSITLLGRCHVRDLLRAISYQTERLMEGQTLKTTRNTCSLYRTVSQLDKGCKLAAKLIHTIEGAGRGTNADGTLEMIFEVWVEMLCYTAYSCNEKSHAKNLTSGGDLMTIVALMMVYMSNGFIIQKSKEEEEKKKTSDEEAGTSST
ncbi:unnamed protein product [Triticum turgidum subsp. durum]|uniref:DUF4220 domain-containing protein n=2 Tax=Triticum TaxID=4564 RepID=A0A9R0VET9_TRITD|nr:unnamed protein product [Triticum turgidum subsp. durum]